jgi:hypothetical protein
MNHGDKFSGCNLDLYQLELPGRSICDFYADQDGGGSSDPNNILSKSIDIMKVMQDEHQRGEPFLRHTGMEPGLAIQVEADGQCVNPSVEWNLVVMGSEYVIQSASKQPDFSIPRREIGKDLAYFVSIGQMQLSAAKNIYPDLSSMQLHTAEVTALRMWTGPMYKRYSYLLRGSFLHQGEDKDDPCQYTTTLWAISSGISNLSRIWNLAPGKKVYRGFRDSSAWLCDRELKGGLRMKGKVGVERSLLATSELPEVAMAYSTGGTDPLVLEIDSGENSGVSLSWLSQFPHEQEVLFGAGSLLYFLDEIPSKGDVSVRMLSRSEVLQTPSTFILLITQTASSSSHSFSNIFRFSPFHIAQLDYLVISLYQSCSVYLPQIDFIPKYNQLWYPGSGAKKGPGVSIRNLAGCQ